MTFSLLTPSLFSLVLNGLNIHDKLEQKIGSIMPMKIIKVGVEEIHTTTRYSEVQHINSQNPYNVYIRAKKLDRKPV